MYIPCNKTGKGYYRMLQEMDLDSTRIVNQGENTRSLNVKPTIEPTLCPEDEEEHEDDDDYENYDDDYGKGGTGKKGRGEKDDDDKSGKKDKTHQKKEKGEKNDDDRSGKKDKIYQKKDKSGKDEDDKTGKKDKTYQKKDKKDDSNNSGNGCCGTCCSVEDAVDPTTRNDNSTLYRILNRGYLNCGVGPLGAPGFLWETSPGSFAGLEVDVCTAVAAALFGYNNLERSTEELNQDDYTGTSRVRLIPIPPELRWQYLLHHPEEEHGVDVLFRSTHTLERDVYEPTTRQGFEFPPPTSGTIWSLGAVPPTWPVPKPWTLNPRPTV